MTSDEEMKQADGYGEPITVSGMMPEEKTAPAAGNDAGGAAAKTEPPKKTLLGKIYNPETRFGRFMRSLTTWVLVILFAYLAGIATFFFVYHVPQTQDLDQTKMSVISLEENNESIKRDDEALRQKYSELETASHQTQASLENALNRENQFRLLYQLTYARYQFETKKDVTEAQKTLSQAKETFDKLYPVINAKNAGLAEQLKNRFSLVVSGLSGDSKIVLADMEIFRTSILDLSKDILKN